MAWLWARASSQTQKLELEKQAASQQGAAEELKKQSAALARAGPHAARPRRGRAKAARRRRQGSRRPAREYRRTKTPARGIGKKTEGSVPVAGERSAAGQQQTVHGPCGGAFSVAAKGSFRRPRTAQSRHRRNGRAPAKGRGGTSRRGHQNRIGAPGSLRRPAHRKCSCSPPPARNCAWKPEAW